jgi:hypothetical protein
MAPDSSTSEPVCRFSRGIHVVSEDEVMRKAEATNPPLVRRGISSTTRTKRSNPWAPAVSARSGWRVSLPRLPMRCITRPAFAGANCR